MEELKSAAVMMNYIRNSNVNIFDFIKNAIMVAASDHPHEFQTKKDKIVETLFSCHDLMNPDDETTTVDQVLKLKQILDSSVESEAVLLELLSKLQRMVKSVNILKLTGVGRSVNPLRNHASKHVAEISTTLVREWKRMVDKWLKDNNEDMQQQVVVESKQNPKNPPQTVKKTRPTSNQHRPLVVRIKLKKDDPKGPLTPHQKVEDNKNNHVAVVDHDDEGLKIKAVVDESHGSKETGLKTERKMEWVSSGKLKKRTIDDAGCIEDKFEAAKRKFKKGYEEAEMMRKKRKIQVIEFHELPRKGLDSYPNRPSLKRQTRRRW